MAAKSQHAAVKKEQSLSISSPNVLVPAKCSSFYKDYNDKLESGYHLLKEPLCKSNYKDKFHHLLCWEEREHIKQLAER